MLRRELYAAAQILEAYADVTRSGAPIDLCNIATGYLMKGERETAGEWYRLVLHLDPSFAIAHLNLVSIHAAGNVPVEILLPTRTCCRIKYAIDYALEDEDGQLPPYDLVFNAIGEPDIAASFADRLEAFVLGERAMAAIAAIGRRLDLDYGGMDFTLLADGRLFVFEANATMLVHGERLLARRRLSPFSPCSPGRQRCA